MRGDRSVRVRGTLILLAASALTQGCVTARPWRSCGPPCGGKQLASAETVLVFTRDHTQVLLTHATAGKDERGPFVAGKGTVAGKKYPDVKVYMDRVCAIHTRRVELGRIAENVILVPAAIAGEIVVAIITNGEVEGWELPVEPLPAGCEWIGAPPKANVP
jgi:hypothetical protein